MKFRSLVCLLAVLLLSLLLVACGGENGEGGSDREIAAENSFLRLLRFVADPPIAPEDEQANFAVWRWSHMIQHYDDHRS